MKELQPYLIFPGTCQEALDFYSDALDGEIVMLDRYADSPLDVAPEHGDRVFNAAFRAGGVAFMASDNMPDQALDVGTNFSMFVAFSEPAEQRRVFEALGRGGKVLMPLGDGFAMLEDRFRIRWMLAVEESR